MGLVVLRCSAALRGALLAVLLGGGTSSQRHRREKGACQEGGFEREEFH
jgi:hypothetical protein